MTIQGVEVILKDQLKYGGNPSLGSCKGCNFITTKEKLGKDLCAIIQSNPHTSCLNHDYIYVWNTPEGIVNYLDHKLNDCKEDDE